MKKKWISGLLAAAICLTQLFSFATLTVHAAGDEVITVAKITAGNSYPHPVIDPYNLISPAGLSPWPTTDVANTSYQRGDNPIWHSNDTGPKDNVWLLLELTVAEDIDRIFIWNHNTREPDKGRDIKDVDITYSADSTDGTGGTWKTLGSFVIPRSAEDAQPSLPQTSIPLRDKAKYIRILAKTSYGSDVWGLGKIVLTRSELQAGYLENKIAQAEALKANLYTQTSWDAMQLVLGQAKTVANNGAATESERLTAFYTLTDAIYALVPAGIGGGIVFHLDPDRPIDNLEVLPVGSARYSPGINLLNHGSPKYFWYQNFGASPNHFIEWTVDYPGDTDAVYCGWIHMSTNSAATYQITVEQGSQTWTTQFTTTGKGWELADVDNITIPKGESTITLTKLSGSTTADIKGLEMIRKSDLADYKNRVAAFKSDTTWLAESGYGLFFQYGVWGYPQFGPKKSAEAATNDFDVKRFINMVESTGSKYVIWSLTWWEYRMQMPVEAVDRIMGHSRFTTERNLVGEIAQALKDRGIGFFLYYHQGMQQEPTWKAKQNWPESFTTTGGGDRSTFFDNWEAVITEIGETLGENLDGWYFDDGCTYWPAPFERLGAAAKTGNPNRILSYNSWYATRYTEFQETVFNEDTWAPANANAPTNEHGIVMAGREKGLLYSGMPTLEGWWGIEHANQTIELKHNASTIIANVRNAMNRKVPLALNIQMWEDGTVGADTLQALIALKDAVRVPLVSKVWGNVSGTGTLNVGDARMILQHLVHKITLDEEQLEIANVSGNENLGVTDARLILQMLVQKIDKFPIEK
ncbi:MAG: alpha-L-fucosidase [Oscillospiraceae bacterium]|nr:alpha-L-fucosidase [Oscillospiraceae bacterium]